MDVKGVHLKTGKTGKGPVGDAKETVKIIGNGEMSRKNNLVRFLVLKNNLVRFLVFKNNLVQGMWSAK